MSSIFNRIYGPGADDAASIDSLSRCSPHGQVHYDRCTATVTDLLSRISVFFLLIAFGVRYDTDTPNAIDVSWHYLLLMKAAFSLVYLPTHAEYFTVVVLLLHSEYLCAHDRTHDEERWLDCGLAARIAQRVTI